MYQKPISKDFLKNINLVLSGETTQKFPLSAELQKHAKMAANELKNIFLDEGVSSAEKKRDVIRQNLVAGLKECNCDATEKLVSAYEDLVWENYNEKEEEQTETVETEEVAEEVETAETDEVTEANHIIEVTGALTDFVKELNEDEVRILKNLLAKH